MVAEKVGQQKAICFQSLPFSVSEVKNVVMG